LQEKDNSGWQSPVIVRTDAGQESWVRRRHRAISSEPQDLDAGPRHGGVSLNEALVTIERYAREPLSNILPAEEKASAPAASTGFDDAKGHVRQNLRSQPLVFSPNSRTLSYLMCSRDDPAPDDSVVSLVDDGDSIPTAARNDD